VEANRDQLERRASFDLRRPQGIHHGWRAWRAWHENAGPVDSDHASDSVGVSHKAQLDDIDPEEVTEVFLSVAGLLGLLVVAAVVATVVFALGTL
jgi:hypothetical protein